MPSGQFFKICTSQVSKKDSLALSVFRFLCKTIFKLLIFTLQNTLVDDLFKCFWALEFVCPNQDTGLPNNLNLSLIKTLLPNLKSDVTSKHINYINNNKQIREHQQKTFVMLSRFFAVKWVGV